VQISDYVSEAQDDVIALWQRCGLLRPWNDAVRDIARKQTDLNGRFLLGYDTSKLVATIMVGYDGHRGSVNYLAVDPDHTGRGYGKTLMNHAEQFLVSVGCPKINLCVRHDNDAAKGFYQELGYSEERVTFFGKRLIDDV
jgi:ribosomal protein S18 acetylase RimI-like enzyme